MRSLLIFLCCFFTFFLYAQQPTLVWAKSMGGGGDDLGLATTVDAAGNVYTTGGFAGTADFDPGPGIFNLTEMVQPANSSTDIFISKLNAAGNFVWAKSMGGVGGDRGLSIAVDAAGNVYTTGSFIGVVDFDPGPGIFNLGMPLISFRTFVSKLDAAGNFVWAKDLGGTSFVPSIKLDASGQIYITDGPVIYKLDASGNFAWQKIIGSEDDVIFRGVEVNAAGDVYAIGRFRGTVDFDPGPGIFNLTSAGDYDIFVSKLNASGDFVWAKSMGGGSSEVGNSIALDASGNVYTTGYFGGTADFDPSPGYNRTTYYCSG